MGMMVDVLYRGVPFVQGATATAHAAGLAMVAAPTPMPVGTPLELRLANGDVLTVRVRAVHESSTEARDDAPVVGMVLEAADEPQAAWINLVGDAPPAEVLPNRSTQTLSAVDIATATAAAAQMERAAAVEPGVVMGRRTRELSSQELAAATQAAGTIAEPIRAQRASKPNLAAPPDADPTAPSDGIVDDGKATTVMEAVSPELLASLGLSAETSGAMAAVEPEASGSMPAADASGAMPAAGGGKKKKSSKKR